MSRWKCAFFPCRIVKRLTRHLKMHFSPFSFNNGLLICAFSTAIIILKIIPWWWFCKNPRFSPKCSSMWIASAAPPWMKRLGQISFNTVFNVSFYGSRDSVWFLVFPWGGVNFLNYFSSHVVFSISISCVDTNKYSSVCSSFHSSDSDRCCILICRP